MSRPFLLRMLVHKNFVLSLFQTLLSPLASTLTAGRNCGDPSPPLLSGSFSSAFARSIASIARWASAMVLMMSCLRPRWCSAKASADWRRSSPRFFRAFLRSSAWSSLMCPGLSFVGAYRVLTSGVPQLSDFGLSAGAARGIPPPGHANPITTGFSPVLAARLWTLPFGPCGGQRLRLL